jgi:RNA polymerase sigma-70 factor (ECF subfamily)
MDSDFLTVFNETKHDIYRLVYNYMKNSYDTDDIVQNVYLKLHKKIGRLKNDEHIKRWLIRVAINECKSHFASSWINKIVPLDETLMDDHDLETDDEVLQAVMSLSPKLSVVIHLYYYEGYSVSEIADVLKCEEEAIKKRLQRARERLKETLKEAWAYE